jgi:hypothetical protein
VADHGPGPERGPSLGRRKGGWAGWRPHRSLALVGLSLLLPLGLHALASRPDSADAAPSLCVITPRITDPGGRPPAALVAVSRPTLFVVEPLIELQILEGNRLLWRQGPPAGSARPLAGAPFGALPTGTIEGPVPWPLAPIRPGQALTLRLRPLESGPAAYAVVRLIGSPAGQLARGDALLASLGRDPHRWRLAVEAAMERGDLPLASALLFAFEGPGAADLDALRLTVIRRSCQPADGPQR